MSCKFTIIYKNPLIGDDEAKEEYYGTGQFFYQGSVFGIESTSNNKTITTYINMHEIIKIIKESIK